MPAWGNKSNLTLSTEGNMLCKRLSKVSYKSSEIEVMKLLNGRRNIIRFDRLDEDAVNYYIWMEYCSGGNLAEYYESYLRPLPKAKIEKSIKPIVVQCLQGIKSCHDMNIVHSDVKLENFVLGGNASKIKLIDFGAAHILGNKDAVVGCTQSTAEYTAPEALRSELGLRSDIWALGVMVFFMIQKRFPFVDPYNTRYGIWKSILNDQLEFKKGDWEDQGVSGACQDFVKLALMKEYISRLWVDDCLAHPWLEKM